ncbi:MAG TPA: 5-dehydro-2-deoxygluconokinase [Steroidobacteraceae bacterium]|nr:5-dehydro-2-deoxygluconokinase [Steroidobacteraceae bacterium]
MTDATAALDVICLGRAAVDLYGQQSGGRLEDMQSFAKSLGGSSGNLAVGLARLGRRAAMLTRVGDEHMGRFVREQLARERVDVSHVNTDPERLTGLVLLGIAGGASYPHIFFRAHCADMGLVADDFDAAWIGSSRALAVTGTHLSSPATRAAVHQAMRWARDAGRRVVLDVDYRPVLWGLAAAGAGESRYVVAAAVTEALQQCLGFCDLVVGTEEEIRIAGGSDDTEQALRAIRARTASAVIVQKRGAEGCVVHEPCRAARVVPGFPVEVFNVLGAGDAFLAGLLTGWLEGADWERSARLGNACGALVVTRHGCSPAMPTRVELDAYLARAADMRRPDDDERIAHLHRATTTRRPHEELHVLAFDHRRQLEALANDTGATATRIAQFKGLVASAVERVAAVEGAAQLGVIVDERHGMAALERFTHAGLWVGRPVELPASKPLRFESREEPGLALRDWPSRQVVKCLAFYHPDDPAALRRDQEARLMGLHADCVTLERELLLELITTANGLPTDDRTTARALTRLYNLGIAPAWWKLEPQTPASWQAIAEVIATRDPWCNGVLLLGLDAPEPDLVRSFAAAAKVPICRGFAVGRSIFGAAARRWFAGEVDDEQAVVSIADGYRRLIGAWRAARAETAT